MNAKKKSDSGKLPDSLRNHTGYLITDVARLYRTEIDRKMSAFDLTRSQWWLISFLVYFDGMTQQELADLMDMGKAAVTKLIDRLEEKGMVKRVNDPEDARQKRVYLSAHVKPLAAEIEIEINEVARTSLSTFTAAEVSQLNKLVTRIRRNLLATAAGAGKPD